MIFLESVVGVARGVVIRAEPAFKQPRYQDSQRISLPSHPYKNTNGEYMNI